jgi:hypothetical protein
MVSALLTGAALLLWVLAASKARSTVRAGSGAARWLLASLAFLAVGITIFIPTVQSRLSQASGIDQLQEPLARTAVVAAALCAQLPLSLTRGLPLKRLTRARWFAYAIGTAAVLWATFAAGPSTPSSSFGSHPVADLSMTLYIVAFLAYLSYVIAAVMHGTWRLAESTGGVLLRRSMLAIALGCGCCLVYASVKVTAIVGYLVGRPIPVVVESVVAQTCVAVGALLVAGGAGAVHASERTAELRGWIHDWRQHRRLYRLWADLTAAVPGVVLDSASGPWRDAGRLRYMHLRLYRRVIEIRDAWLVLRPFMDERDTGGSAPATSAVNDTAATAKLEVCMLRSALIAQREGSPSLRPQDTSRPLMVSLEDELAWWSAVATYWDQATERAAAQAARVEA